MTEELGTEKVGTAKLDLVEAVETSFRQLVSSGKIETMIEAQLETLIQGLLKDTIRSYSDFGKQIDQKVRAALAIGEFTLPQYGERVCKLIETLTESMIDSTFHQSLKKRLHDLLIGAPETIKLSKLCEQFAEDFDRERYGQRWSFHFERTFPNSDSLAHYFTLSFDDAEGLKPNGCDYHLGLRKIDRLEDVEAYEPVDVTFGSHSTKDRLFCERHHGFAATLWQMYAARTLIVFDVYPEDICTTIGSD